MPTIWSVSDISRPRFARKRRFWSRSSIVSIWPFRITEPRRPPFAFTKQCSDRSLQQLARVSVCEDFGGCACRRTHPIRLAHFLHHRGKKTLPQKNGKQQA